MQMKLQLEWERATSASLAAKLEKALASQQRAEELVADVPMLTAQVLLLHTLVVGPHRVHPGLTLLLE